MKPWVHKHRSVEHAAVFATSTIYLSRVPNQLCVEFERDDDFAEVGITLEKNKVEDYDGVSDLGVITDALNTLGILGPDDERPIPWVVAYMLDHEGWDNAIPLKVTMAPNGYRIQVVGWKSEKLLLAAVLLEDSGLISFLGEEEVEIEDVE